MPRGRCHWALLVLAREAFKSAHPAAYVLASENRPDYFAGGIAPDALRLFGGRDKLSTHFYDDQRPETWDVVVEAICTAYPEIANPSDLDGAARAWMVGYLTHILTDIAYWRHIVTRLPPFPEHQSIHHGAWMLADQIATPAAERHIDVDAIRFDRAPPWIEPLPVQELLGRMARWFTAPDDVRAVELAYYRNRASARGETEADLLAEHGPQWDQCLTLATQALPPHVWSAFQRAAVEGATRAVAAYLPR